jgi:hypothetical protein
MPKKNGEPFDVHLGSEAFVRRRPECRTPGPGFRAESAATGVFDGVAPVAIPDSNNAAPAMGTRIKAYKRTRRPPRLMLKIQPYPGNQLGTSGTFKRRRKPPVDREPS